MSRVVIKSAISYASSTVNTAINELLDAGNINVEGRKVLVKPNMLGLFKPEKAATTHPSIISALVEALKKRGASQIIVGDNPGVGGYAISDKVARVSGIGPAAKDAYKNISKEGVQIKIRDRYILVSRDVLDADVLINVPKFKTHTLTMITGGIKNMFGIIIGGEKANAHRRYASAKDFSEFMAEVCAVRPPDFTIMDAIIGMEGNGPSGGSPRNMGLLMASNDVVALDAVMARMVGLKPHELPMIRRAEELKLGKADDFSVEGPLHSILDFKLPVTAAAPGGIIQRIVNSVGFFFVSRRVPVLIKKYCTGCEICVKACPVSALTMHDKYPRLDYRQCISCFCCHEQCPSEAWDIKVKILHR